MTFDGRDIDVYARTLYGEIRGGSWIDKVAVGWVIRNRVEIDLGNDGKPDWWGEGIAGVYLKPWQFSCWNENDPNRAKLLAATADWPVFRECLAAAAHVLSAPRSECPVQRATHYYAPKGVKAPPAWVAGAELVCIVGPHRFYQNVK